MVKKNKKQISTPKFASLNVNDGFKMFQMKLYEIIFKKADINSFDSPSIKLYVSWRTQSSIQGNKEPLHISEYGDFNNESDCEGVVQ